jgi:hypothetical protein
LEVPLRPSSDVVWRDLEGEAVLLDLASGTYFGLNDVGTRIWRLLEAGESLARIAEALAEEYEVSGEQAARDAEALVKELRGRGLLVEAPPGETP